MIDFKLLNKIMDGIESGTLKHVQDDFHCGTSHCFAGWVEIFDLRTYGYSETFNCDGDWFDGDTFVSSSPLTRNTWDYACQRLGLTYSESTLLFANNSPLILQRAVVDLLNRGLRIDADCEVEIDGFFVGGDFCLFSEGVMDVLEKNARENQCL